MKARWAIAAAMAIVASPYALRDTTASVDARAAVEARAQRSSSPQSRPEWRDDFDVNKADLLPTGTNAYITMQPGRVLTLEHGNDTLIVTVLAQTQEVDGVVTGVVEER